VSPDLVRDQADRDAITLRAAIDMHMALVAECRNCRRVSQVDVLEMIGRLGAAATIGTLRSKCRCELCKTTDPYILMREKGVRGDKAWSPRPPVGR
jgi:hypothetical protein